MDEGKYQHHRQCMYLVFDFALLFDFYNLLCSIHPSIYPYCTYLFQSGLDASSYTLKTRNICTRLDPDRINMELIVDLLSHLDTDPVLSAVEGAVLVFMPGLSHIRELHDLLQSDPRFNNTEK